MAFKQQLNKIATSNKQAEKIFKKEADIIKQQKREQLKKDIQHRKRADKLNKNLAEIKRRQQEELRKQDRKSVV